MTRKSTYVEVYVCDTEMVRSALGSEKIRSAPGFALRSGALSKERGVRAGAPHKERHSPFERGEGRAEKV